MLSRLIEEALGSELVESGINSSLLSWLDEYVEYTLDSELVEGGMGTSLLS